MLLIIAVSKDSPWSYPKIARTDGDWLRAWGTEPLGFVKADADSKYYVFGIELDRPEFVQIIDPMRIKRDGKTVVVNANVGNTRIRNYEIPVGDFTADEETLKLSSNLRNNFIPYVTERAEKLRQVG